MLNILLWTLLWNVTKQLQYIYLLQLRFINLDFFFIGMIYSKKGDAISIKLNDVHIIAFPYKLNKSSPMNAY